MGERICREFFNQLFNCEFKKIYPDWLRNEDGKKLELDGYNNEIRIAFEHQGIHHFKIDFYTKTKKKLIKIRRDDKRKVDLCNEHEIDLFIIPEIPRLLKVKECEFVRAII